jgi:WD40-like Beta Propeller Repeat
MTSPLRLNGLRPLVLLALGGACVVLACSSGSGSLAAAIPSGGASGSTADSGSGGVHRLPTQTAGSGGRAGSGSAEAGAAGTVDSAGEAGMGGAGGEQQGTVVVVPPSACSETPAWTGATPLAGVSTSGDASLLSITADELDLAFLRAGALYLAHRSAASASFAAAQPVTLPTGYVATAGVAFSADGETLVLVSSDGQSFAALTRGSRTADFSATADTTAFAGLNARAIQTLEHYAAPVLAPDGKSFVFSGFSPDAGTSLVYESLLSGAAWAMPKNLSVDLFDGSGGKRPLPSGLSSDSRTLFYFDEATSKEVARYRDRPDAPLYYHVDLGDLAGAVPNEKCDRVYYSTAGNLLTESD